MQAYCMKCRAKREMRNARAITMKNGKPATQGICPVCGTKMFRIGKGQSDIGIQSQKEQLGIDRQVPSYFINSQSGQKCNKKWA